MRGRPDRQVALLGCHGPRAPSGVIATAMTLLWRKAPAAVREVSLTAWGESVSRSALLRNHCVSAFFLPLLGGGEEGVSKRTPSVPLWERGIEGDLR